MMFKLCTKLDWLCVTFHDAMSSMTMTRGLTLVKSAPREIARGQEKVKQEFVCQSKETKKKTATS